MEQATSAPQVFPATPGCSPPLSAQCGPHQQELGPPALYTCANSIHPLAQPCAGTAVCKAASLSCAVPKVAPFLLATMKASGELNCEGLPVNPGQCPDFPSSKVHAYTGTYPAIMHLQTCLLGECLLTQTFFPSSPTSSPFISISPEPCQNVLQLPFTLPCKQTGVPFLRERQ